MKKGHWILCFILSLGLGCKTTVDTPIGYKDSSLIFGNGGGITGAVTSYTLLANGQIFKSQTKMKDQWQQHATISKKTAQQLIDKSLALEINLLEHNHPGNTYKFIQTNIDGKENYICWGDKQSPIETTVKDFYFQLIEQVK